MNPARIDSHSSQHRLPASRHRGAIIVLTLVTVVTLIGFAALTLDVGALYNTRADMQNAADSASLAGASALASDAMFRVRQGTSQSSYSAEAMTMIRRRAQEAALRNSSFAGSGTIIGDREVLSGWIDLSSGTSPIDPNRPFSEHNAVHVFAQRAPDSANGPVEFFFSSIFGKDDGEASASAVAAFDDRVAGFDPSAGDGYLWPVTVSSTYYEEQVAAGNDFYDWDSSSESALSGGDGMPEVNAYPSNPTPGNFGLLNIGVGNQGDPVLEDHIENGVPPEHVENEIGTTELTFYDDQGNATTYNITGDPGLKAALEPAIETRVGDIVAILIHDQATEQGATTVFRITGIRFARVMDVTLQGAAQSRGLWLQPVSFAGPGVITSPGAPSSGGAAGKLILVR